MEPVVIIGGGIIGASVARYLAAASVPVHLVEKDTLGAGTTSDSVAVFVTHQTDPDATEQELRALAWEEYEPMIEAGTIEYEQIGTLQTTRSAASLSAFETAAAELESLGIGAEVRDGDGLAEFGLDSEVFAGGLYVPTDGYFDPTEIIQAFVTAARDEGATIETGVEVTDIRVENGAVVGVKTTDGTIPAQAVVNAAGPWAPRVNAMVDVSLPLRHTFGPIIVLNNDEAVRMPLTFFEDGYYLREEGDRQAFAGRLGTDYDTATEIDPDAAHGVDETMYQEMAALIGEAVPGLADAEISNEWVGVRTVTPDGHPFVGPTDIEDFHVAVGMSGHGVTLAPAIGSLLAEYITSDEQPPLLEYLTPMRELLEETS